MKHIKRKYSVEFKIDEMPESFLQIPLSDLHNPVPEGRNAFIETDTGTFVRAFTYTTNNRTYTLPEPHPVLVYFNVAQWHYRQLIEAKGELIKSVSKTENLEINGIGHSFYNYLANSTGLSIFLFMSLETMMNSILAQKGVTYFQHNKTKTISYDWLQIQRMEFVVKMKDAAPKMTRRNFTVDHPKEWQFILLLKELRDELVHTKTLHNDKTPYTGIYNRSLTFDYLKALQVSQLCINYFIPDLVQECDCGLDH